MDDQLAEQVASLLESTAALQRTLAHVLSQLPPKQHLPSLSDLNLHTPASAQASIIAPGVPIPSRGWQKDHSPRQRVAAEAKSRLMRDGWSDCDDTDIHAARLTEAMLRMGMEDMDNFMTEVCAAFLSSKEELLKTGLMRQGVETELFEYGNLPIVATFMSETYSSTETLHMRVVNGLWFLSLFLSLATATTCMLVSEWLTWSTSQELRDLSLLYRLIRTAFRSLFMHLSIFLFFAGLLVLMWNESTMAVCAVPSVAVGLFVVYYVSATVRSPLYSLLFDIRQFDDKDFRGLRVQIWTPFTLGTHHLINYLFVAVINPIRKLVRRWNARRPEVLEPEPQRPQLPDDLPDSEKAVTLALETANINMNGRISGSAETTRFRSTKAERPFSLARSFSAWNSQSLSVGGRIPPSNFPSWYTPQAASHQVETVDRA
ncbi:unnamed protein product [Rhizoctonia solani]|uniref:DUF6535 domain-containing protein n=1 Tax=Rhizoctonia solani TaxID=456999 RepID=A0A8H2XQ75_9AGAM|nr:unnamed protein product [Rhizoctonia solani]